LVQLGGTGDPEAMLAAVKTCTATLSDADTQEVVYTSIQPTIFSATDIETWPV